MTDYVDARKAYLERLLSIRQREQRHLSQVDFELLISRFDPLIAKVKAQIASLESASSISNPAKAFKNPRLQLDSGFIYVNASVVPEAYLHSSPTVYIAIQNRGFRSESVSWCEMTLPNNELPVPPKSAWKRSAQIPAL